MAKKQGKSWPERDQEIGFAAVNVHSKKLVDPVEDDAVVIYGPAEGEVFVDVLDENNRVSERIAIPSADAGFQIHHAGKVLRHVSTHSDGTWQYAE